MKNMFFLSVRDKMQGLKAHNLPIKLIFWGGAEIKFCADLLYLHRDGMDLTFIVPLYPEIPDRIETYMRHHYPDAKLVYIRCLSECGEDGLHACDDVLAPWRDIEHINVCSDAFDYSIISECEQCQHIKPNESGYAPPKADGTQGKVWNYFPFIGMSDKDVAEITHRRLNCLSTVLCPFRRDRMVEWWDVELRKEGI